MNQPQHTSSLDRLWSKYLASSSYADVLAASPVECEGYILSACNHGECTAFELSIAVNRERLLTLFHALVPKIGKAVVPMFHRMTDTQDVEAYKGKPMNPHVLNNRLQPFTDILENDRLIQLHIYNLRETVRLRIDCNKHLQLHASRKNLEPFRRETEKFGIGRADMLYLIGDEVEPDPSLMIRQNALIDTLDLTLVNTTATRK